MAEDEPRPGFNVSETKKAGLLDRMLGRAPKEAAFVEIRNILATTPLDQVRPGEVAAALAKSKLSQRDAVQELQGVFEHAAFTLAFDRELSSGDRRALAFLQRSFELTDDEARLSIERAVAAVFQKVMRESLADGRFTPAEREVLMATAATLGMTESQTKQVYETAAVAAVQSAFDVVVADRRYSEADEAQVQALAASLGVVIEHSEKTAALLDRFRLMARIEDGSQPPIEVPILLQRGEVCFFTIPDVSYKELRTVTKRVNYSGPSASIRIMKGVRWRMGSVSVQRITQDVMTELDVVDLFITNKKVFLRGARKNTSLPFSKLAHFTVYSDGIQLEKHTGKDLFLVGSADWELAGAYLDMLARRSK
jgi:hypothetical protein